MEKDHGYIGRQFSSEHINDGYLSQGELGNIFENVCFKFHTQRKYHIWLKSSMTNHSVVLRIVFISSKKKVETSWG